MSMICKLCREIITGIGDTPNGVEHDKCIDQWVERSTNKKCLRCGKPRASNSTRCADCTVDSPYQNYEGPKNG